uniref:CBFD_NFYB_HMF domain-containing protein n=1 Tax=Caenorhabditis tropicalis TaxID=1561998 RepID=A0A1I7T0F4_9PELO
MGTDSDTEKLENGPEEWVKAQIKLSNIQCDKNGLLMLTKSVELFIQELMSGASQHGSQVLDYDNMADYIQFSNFNFLKGYFPSRVRYEALLDYLKENNEEEYLKMKDGKAMDWDLPLARFEKPYIIFSKSADQKESKKHSKEKLTRSESMQSITFDI